MSLGWKKTPEEEVIEMGSNPPEKDDHHDEIVEAVLSTAAKKAEEKGIEVGKDFELTLSEVRLEPHMDPEVVDFDVALPALAGDYCLLFKESSDDSIAFQRIQQ